MLEQWLRRDLHGVIDTHGDYSSAWLHREGRVPGADSAAGSPGRLGSGEWWCPGAWSRPRSSWEPGSKRGLMIHRMIPGIVENLTLLHGLRLVVSVENI